MKPFPRFIAVHFSRFVKDDNGADLVEYALIIGLVSLAAITALGTSTTGVAGAIAGLFGELTTAIGNVNP